MAKEKRTIKDRFLDLIGAGSKEAPPLDKDRLRPAVTFHGYTPTFSSFGDNVLLSDIVLEAIRIKADFCSKLDPRHIRTDAHGARQRINDSSIARVLREPNEFTTRADFFYKAAFLREVTENCFIYPDYYWTKGGYKYYTGAYIIQPSRWRYLQDEETGALYIGFKFDGRKDEVIFEYSEIIHWRKHYEYDAYDGGGKYSDDEKREVLGTLQAYRTICESIAEAAKCSCYFDGILKVAGFGDELPSIQKIRDDFVADIRTNKEKVPVLDNGAEWQEVKRNLKIVDELTLSHFEKKILRFTGVNAAMLAGDFTPAQKEAFYERNIESGIMSLGQIFTKVCFTKWQKSHGDEIVFYPHKTEFMSTSEKTAVLSATAAMGVWSINQVLDMFGYPPVEGGDERPRGYNNLDGGQPAAVGNGAEAVKNEGTGGAENEETE